MHSTYKAEGTQRRYDTFYAPLVKFVAHSYKYAFSWLLSIFVGLAFKCVFPLFPASTVALKKYITYY